MDLAVKKIKAIKNAFIITEIEFRPFLDSVCFSSPLLEYWNFYAAHPRLDSSNEFSILGNSFVPVATTPCVIVVVALAQFMSENARLYHAAKEQRDQPLCKSTRRTLSERPMPTQS